MIPDDWTEHRRDDGELLGWIRPERDLWLAIDVLGREASAAIEWLEAEAALEEVGLSWLADPWMLEGEGPAPLRVRILEVTPSDPQGHGRIVVKIDDFGAIGGELAQQFVLPWPIPSRLRVPQPGDPDGFTFG